MRLLEGVIEEAGDSEEIERLRDENRDLRRELSTARTDIATAKRETTLALGALRKTLGPLYSALQFVFGELDAAGVDEAPAASGSANPRTMAVWDAWKSRIGGQPAQLIDAFLLHGEMTSGQIAIAIGINAKNVAHVVHKLNKAGLIQKNGGKFSLKSI